MVDVRRTARGPGCRHRSQGLLSSLPVRLDGRTSGGRRCSLRLELRPPAGPGLLQALSALLEQHRIRDRLSPSLLRNRRHHTAFSNTRRAPAAPWGRSQLAQGGSNLYQLAAQPADLFFKIGLLAAQGFVL